MTGRWFGVGLIIVVGILSFWVKGDDIISPEEAQQAAQAGYNSRQATMTEKLRQAMNGARPGQPLLVKRMERNRDDFYIVPFYQISQEKITALILVNAYTAEFKEASFLQNPAPYPSVDQRKAENILRGYWQDQHTSQPQSNNFPKPILVWEPCMASQSPYEPLWDFMWQGQDWYVSQDGKVWTNLEPPPLLGG